MPKYGELQPITVNLETNHGNGTNVTLYCIGAVISVNIETQSGAYEIHGIYFEPIGRHSLKNVHFFFDATESENIDPKTIIMALPHSPIDPLEAENGFRGTERPDLHLKSFKWGQTE